MEQYNNEVTEYKSKLEDNKNNLEITKLITEKNAALYNLKIYKESLMNNLQILIVFLETKEKERNDTAHQISNLTDKENEYLRSRYTIEDMIQVLQDSLTNVIPSEVINGSISSDKSREKFMELIKCNDKLDKLNFIALNKTYPYKIIDDLLDYSSNEIKILNNDLNLMKSSLSDMVKDNLKIVFEMIESKIELLQEQSLLIRHLYNIFTNLESEIKDKEGKSYADSSNSNNVCKPKKSIHIEFIYKEMIIKFLTEVYRVEPEKGYLMGTEEKERLERERLLYINEKQANFKKLEQRNNYLAEVDDYDLSEVNTFGYTKPDNKSGGLFSWMGNVFSK